MLMVRELRALGLIPESMSKVMGSGGNSSVAGPVIILTATGWWLFNGRDILYLNFDIGPAGHNVVLTTQSIGEGGVRLIQFQGMASWLISPVPGSLGVRLPRSKLPVAAPAILPSA